MAGRIALSTIGEGGEEVVEDVLQPFLKRATYDPEARFDIRETEHDALIGAILGGFGGSVEAVGNTVSRYGQNQTGKGAGAPRVTETVQSAAEPSAAVQLDVLEQEAVRLGGQRDAIPGAETAVNENGLTALTALERENLSSGKKNKVVSTFGEAVKFIQNALRNKQSVDRAYLGKVPDATARMVLEQTGVDISGYHAMMLSDSVRHMFNDHGDPVVEGAQGQIALSPEKVARIPDVLSNPDKVTLSPHTDVRGLPVLLFGKAIDGYYITAQAISNGTHSIQADTLYIRKKAPQDTVSNTGVATGPEHNVRNVLPQEPFNSSITPARQEVKSDPLIDALLGGGKRVADAPFSQGQFDQLMDLSDIAVDADKQVYWVDPAEHIDKRGAEFVKVQGTGGTDIAAVYLRQMYEANLREALAQLGSTDTGGVDIAAVYLQQMYEADLGKALAQLGGVQLYGREKAASPAGETAQAMGMALTSPENMARYREDIDSVFMGGYPQGKIITLGETPDILQKYGAKPLAMTMGQDAAYKIAYPEGYFGGKHNLGMSVLKQLPYQLENPVAILKSNTQENSLAILTEWMDGDKSIIIPVHLDKTGSIEIENRVASAYKMRRMQGYLGDNNQNVLYTRNNEDIHQLLSAGVQFPQARADDVFARSTIPQAGQEVKSDPLIDAILGDRRQRAEFVKLQGTGGTDIAAVYLRQMYEDNLREALAQLGIAEADSTDMIASY